jgi:hypothetical protein
MKIRILSIAVLAGLLVLGCGTTNPTITADFPFFFLQDVDVSGIPEHCCYLSSGGDGVAGADSLYFIDYQNGFVRARVSVEGYTIEDVGATADGGYGLALCGNLLYYVSNDTYTVHSPVPLSSYGVFILTNPTGGNWHLYSVGLSGTITTINSLSWDVTAVDTVTGLQDPVAAVITADGSSIFIADGSDDTIKMISTSNPGTVTAQCTVPGGVADLYAGPGNLIYAAADSLSAIWGIDTGTGQHFSTYPLDSPAVSVAVTPDDNYLFVGFSGSGVSVINTQNLDVEATSTSYGTPHDIAINADGNRAIICSSLGKILSLEK